MKNCFCFLFLVLPLISSGQQPAGGSHHSDSLEAALQKATTDTSKANILFQLSDHWADSDTAKSVAYIQKALQLSLDDYYRGVAHFYLGSTYFNYNIEKAQQEYGKAEKLLSIYTTSRAFLYRSRAWANIGALEQRKNNNQAYINILLNKAIPLAAKGGDSLRMAGQYMNIGLPFMNFRDYDKAIIYFKKAIAIFERHQIHSLTLADCYSNAAKAYLLGGRVQPAKPLLDSAWAILKQQQPSSYHTYYYCQEGLYFTHAGEWVKAEKSLNNGLSLAQSLQNSRDVAMLLFGFVDLYSEQKKLRVLREILLQLYQDTANITNNDRQQVLLDLAKTDAALGNSKAAYDWLWQYTVISDSLYKRQVNYQIAELETRFNYTEKEKEVLRLNERSKMQKRFLWSCLVLLLLAVLLFIYFYKQRRIRNEQQIKSLQQEQQIAVAQALLQGEERERGRVARDLHDGLGGLLANVKINLSDHSGQDSVPVTKTIQQLDHAITELRRIARNLMPEALSRSGLATAIKDLCQSFTSPKMNIDVQTINISPHLDVQVQLIVYRIIQELLNNAAKHSGADEVFVQCSQSGNVFYITVEDNGRGFEQGLAAKDNKGIGLENIRHRVAFLQGKIEIRSLPPKGTEINIELLCYSQQSK